MSSAVIQKPQQPRHVVEQTVSLSEKLEHQAPSFQALELLERPAQSG
jgi:hypothetical protein